MQTYSSQNLNIYIKLDIESKFEVENVQLLRLDTLIVENMFYKIISYLFVELGGPAKGPYLGIWGKLFLPSTGYPVRIKATSAHPHMTTQVQQPASSNRHLPRGAWSP